MAMLFENYWWLFVIALLLGVIVAWWVFAINARTKVPPARKPDALDEGAAPARRNQALIDAPPAAYAAPAAPPPPAPPAATESAAAPAPAPTPAPAPAPATHGDDLMRIKGIGPKLKARLTELGITSLDEIAAWTEADINRIDAQLGAFQGRIRRDSWIEQARYLANNDMAGFEARFGKL